jgi:hypothetical protein
MASALRLCIAVLAFCAALALATASARAKQEAIAPGAVQPQIAGPASPSDASPSCAPCKKCSPRCISYKHHPTLRRTCCTCQTKKVVLQVYDPCCCCCIDVPVCVPACCCNPCASARGGLIARSVTTFRFDCGYKVMVVVGPQGNLVVHSYGR